ncbi:virion structural protein [Vibrio phage BONAISHI]|nr:virion structural protein [Vibrio phage BONAISHI]
MSDLLESLSGHLLLSPASVIDPTMQLVDEIYGGEYDITNANSPWIKLLECSATHAAASHNQSNVLLRKQYPKLAETFEDLYLHMSDDDFLGRFSTPNSNVVVWFAAPVSAIIEQAVLDPAIGLQKLTIPADTTYVVDNTTMFQHWPVDLIVSSDQRVTARYNLDFSTPVKTKTSNVIEYYTATLNSVPYFFVAIECDQLLPKEDTSPVSVATGGLISVNYVDQFYYARVFSSTNGATWTELKTTHTDQTFDPAVPTAVLTVRSGVLDVRIPEIYLTNGLVSGTIKVITMTTKGYTELALSTFDSSVWRARFNDFNDLTQTWSSNLGKINDYVIFGRDTFKGGKGERTFEELKNIVVYNTLDKPAPFTDDELRAELDADGFRVSKQKDTITQRTFVASSSLPAPTRKSDLTSPIGMTNGDVIIDDARTDLTSVLKKLENFTVIRPKALFQSSGGVYSIVDDGTKSTIENYTVSERAEALNSQELYYTPFHYVMDSSEPIFDVRAYWLQSPREYARSFVANNPSLGFLVSTSSVEASFDIDTDTYKLVLTSEAPGNGGDIKAVLNLTDAVTGDRWDMVAQGSTVDARTYTFTFNIQSWLDIDSDGFFTIEGFTGDDAEVRPRISLDSTVIDVVYVIDGNETSSFDSKLARKALTETVTAISYEQLTMTWGKYLDKLYVKTRPLSEPPVYERYATDSIVTYEKDIFQTDDSGYVLAPNDDGDLEPVILYNAGDIMYEDDGVTPKYYHRAGDVVLDPISQLPKEIEPESIKREIRFLLLDAALLYSDTDEIVAYRDTIPDFIIDTNGNEIVEYNNRLLEETELFYEPIATRIASRVIVEQGRERIINAALKWAITVQLYEGSFNNDGIRENIKTSIRAVLAKLSENREISVSQVYDELEDLSTQDIRSIKVESPFGTNNIATLTEDNSKWSIASVAVPLSTGQLDIQDDIDITWIN